MLVITFTSSWEKTMRTVLKFTLLAVAVISSSLAYADDAKTRAVGNIGDFFKRENQPAPAAAPVASPEAQAAAERKRRATPTTAAIRTRDGTRQ
jgi:hypothetical protein